MMQHPLSPGLYIVATPIGNIQDITLRALEVLKAANIIACEDTRVTHKLLKHYDIQAKMLCYNDFSTEKDRNRLIAAICEGQSVALVSDAGSPLISDPGYKLVLEAQHMAVPVHTLPGPSSVIAALTVAGLPTNRFLFEGFLPPKKAARIAALVKLKSLEASLVFFESPRRLVDTLTDMQEALGNREAAVIRELTKHYEEVNRAVLSELIQHYSEHEARGEVIIIVGPPSGEADDSNLDGLLQEALTSMSVKEAVSAVAAQTSFPRKYVYARALELTRK